MNDSEIKALWVYAQQTWRTFEIPADPDVQAVKLVVWRRNLADLHVAAVQAAIDSLNRDHDQWPPGVGEIRAAAVALVAGGPAVPDVDEAWSEVVAAFGAVGRYATPAWSHPAVEATVRAIGWREMCNSTDQGVLRGQFFRLYGVCSERTRRDGVPDAPGVAGYLERAHAANEAAALSLKRVDDVLAIGDGGRS